jgi:hypothetical protein
MRELLRGGDRLKRPGMQFVIKLVPQGMGRKRQAIIIWHETYSCPGDSPGSFAIRTRIIT